jgi:hypothetical protein
MIASDFGQTMSELVQKLARQSELAKFDMPHEAEAERLAHALLDLRESFAKYIDVLLPRLLKAPDEEMIGCLYEIGDEFRHIAYHLRDPKFFVSSVSAPLDGK